MNGYSERYVKFSAYYSSQCATSLSQIPLISSSMINFQPQTTSSKVSVTSSNNVIGSKGGSVQLQFSPANLMLTRGYIYIVVPRLFISSNPADPTNYCVVDTNSGTPSISFMAVAAGGASIQPTRLSTCVLGFSTCSSSLFTTTACTLRMEYSFTRDITSSDTIKISVSSYFSPHNYNSVNGFSIVTAESVIETGSIQNEGRIDILGQTGNVVFTPALTFKSFSSGSVTILNSLRQVESKIPVNTANRLIQFGVNVDFPLLTPCKLIIKFPPEIRVNVDETFQSSFLQTPDGFLTSATFDTAVSFSSSGASGANQVSVLNACASGTQNYANSGSVTFGEIVTPSQVKDVLEFTLELIEISSGKTLAKGTSSSGYVIRQNNFQSGTIAVITLTGFSALNPTVGETSDYVAEFTLGSDLFSYSQFVISLPQFVAQDNTRLGTNPKCKITQPLDTTVVQNAFLSDFHCPQNSLNQLFITNFFQTPSPNPATWVTDTLTSKVVQISIINAGRNPDSVRSAGTWKIAAENILKTTTTSSTYGNYTVSTGSEIAFTTTAGTITTASVLVDPPVTSAQNSVYTFTITLAHKISAQGQVAITLPSQLGIAQASLVRSSCMTNKDSNPTPIYSQTCSVATSGTGVTVITVPLDQGFGSTSLTQSLIIKMQGIQNPRNFEQSSAFTIETKDKQGYTIDQTSASLNSLKVTMSQMAELSDVSVKPSNYTNGAFTNYLVTFVTQYTIKDNDIVVIGYQHFKASSVTNVKTIDPSIQSVSLNSAVTSSEIKVKLNSVGQSTGTFSFQLTNVINPPSTRIYTVFRYFVIYDSALKNVMNMPTSIVVFLQPLLPANILTYSLKQDKLDHSQKAKYTISFKTSNPISSTGSIIITWPVQVKKPTTDPTCSIKASQTSKSCTINELTRSIIVSGGGVFGTSHNGTVDIEVDGLLNPPDNRAINGFLIQTFDDITQSYKIDKLEDDILKPEAPCNYPCKSCTTTSKNYCQSCWSDTGLPFLMINTTNATCKPSCDDGFSSNGAADKKCTKCDISCNLCVDNGNIGDRSRCITCAKGYDFRYTPLQQCLKSCSNGFYQSSPALCSLCSATCKTCDRSASNCTSCNINSPQYKYLFDNQCVDNCPSGFTNVVAECKKCDSKCGTCQNKTSTCTSCDSSSKFKFNFGFDCLEKCPEGTTPDNNKLKCFGCLKGCKLCDSLNQTKCLQCENPLLEYKGSCVATCPSGTSKSFFGATCTTSFFINIPKIPFPHLCGCGVMLLLTLISYMKDRRTLFLTNIIVLWGPIQLISYISQVLFAYLSGTMNYAYTSAIAAGTYVIMNIAFSITFESKIARQDIEYMNWRQHYKLTSKLIIIFSGILSFKILRLHYSFLFGNDKFKAAFDKPGVFQRQIIIFTVLHLLFSSCVIIGVDIVGILSVKSDSQLYTTLIETAILSVSMMILEFVEICKLRHYLGDDITVDYDALVNQMNESMDKKLRQDMLKQIMNHVKAHKDLNLNNRFDELLTDMGPRRTKSMVDFGNELEDDPRRTRSEPTSPRNMGDEFDRNTPLPTIDNVYAESKPADPLGNIGKTYSEFDQQVIPDDFDRFLSRKGGDFVQFDQQNDQEMKRKAKNRKRGRKNQYYTQIDAEDDEEANNMEYDDDGIGGVPKDDLGVIKEEEDEQDAAENNGRSKLPKKIVKPPIPPQKSINSSLQQQEAELLKKRQLEEEALNRKMEEEAAQKELERKIQLEEQARSEERLLKEEKERQLKEEQERLKEKQERLMLSDKLRLEKELKDKLDRELLEKQMNEQKQKIDQENAIKQENERKRQLEERQKQEDEKKRQEEVKRKQDEMERDILLEEERRKKEIAEKKLQEEAEAKKRQEEAKRKADEAESLKRALEQEVEIKNIPSTFSQQPQLPEPVVQVPPDKEKRNFNENDILGDFDRDEKGNVIVLQDDAGNYVDKRGRAVNERGYLKDVQTGDIIENLQSQKMFDRKEMDERGEVPAPYCVEKHNFNPFSVRGDLELDRVGRPVIGKNKASGQLVDKSGQLVNKKGWLVDAEGNVCDRNGRKKFDKKQLTPDSDFPRLFNLNGRRFDILDLCGQLQRDAAGNLVFERNQRGESVDQQGRLVNERGYLVDAAGNVVDKEGKRMFERRFLKNGEFPKIFPFTKFNVKRIQGDFEMDPLGNPILDRGSQGDLVDRQGKRVNAKGYLVDKEGNVIDKHGKLMFERQMLDTEGDIPKVFRTGLLKADTGSSLSRLMSEIERNQPSEYGNPQWRRQQQQEELKKQQKERKQLENGGEAMEKLSGNTSVDSMMEDTPSNYNIANQRFDQTQSNLNAKSLQLQQQTLQNQLSQQRNLAPSNNPNEIDDGSGSGGGNGFDGDYAANDEQLMKKRRLKKKKKTAAAPLQTYGDPSDKDILLAKAYGGAPRGQPKRAIPKNVLQRDTNTPQSNINRNNQMSKVSGVVAGFNRGDKDGERQHSVSMMQLEELKGGESNYMQAVDMTHQNESNDASFAVVPDHHIREQRLKQRKMNELKSKNKRVPGGKRRVGGGGGDPDFEKMFGKDIDEFLEDSDWDIESFDNMSQYSKGTSRSLFNQDGRIRGLESIYLQRIETSMKKGAGGAQQMGNTTKNAKPKKVQAKFRPMQDRFINDPQQIAALENERMSGNIDGSLSQQRASRPHFVENGNSTVLPVNRTMENVASRQLGQKIIQTQYK